MSASLGCSPPRPFASICASYAHVSSQSIQLHRTPRIPSPSRRSPVSASTTAAPRILSVSDSKMANPFPIAVSLTPERSSSFFAAARPSSFVAVSIWYKGKSGQQVIPSCLTASTLNWIKSAAPRSCSQARCSMEIISCSTLFFVTILSAPEICCPPTPWVPPRLERIFTLYNTFSSPIIPPLIFRPFPDSQHLF